MEFDMTNAPPGFMAVRSGAFGACHSARGEPCALQNAASPCKLLVPGTPEYAWYMARPDRGCSPRIRPDAADVVFLPRPPLGNEEG